MDWADMDLDEPTYQCPFCSERLFAVALASHVVGSHADRDGDAVCPICASADGGDPTRLSRNLHTHLMLRHLSASGDDYDPTSLASMESALEVMMAEASFDPSNLSRGNAEQSPQWSTGLEPLSGGDGRGGGGGGGGVDADAPRGLRGFSRSSRRADPPFVPRAPTTSLWAAESLSAESSPYGARPQMEPGNSREQAYRQAVRRKPGPGEPVGASPSAQASETRPDDRPADWGPVSASQLRATAMELSEPKSSAKRDNTAKAETPAGVTQRARNDALTAAPPRASARGRTGRARLVVLRPSGEVHAYGAASSAKSAFVQQLVLSSLA